MCDYRSKTFAGLLCNEFISLVDLSHNNSMMRTMLWFAYLACGNCSLQPIISVGRLFNCISFRVLFTLHCHSNPIDDAIYMYSVIPLSIDLPCHPMNLLPQNCKGHILIVRWVRFCSSVCMNTKTKLAPVTLASTFQLCCQFNVVKKFCCSLKVR